MPLARGVHCLQRVGGKQGGGGGWHYGERVLTNANTNYTGHVYTGD